MEHKEAKIFRTGTARRGWGITGKLASAIVVGRNGGGDVYICQPSDPGGEDGTVAL